MYLATLTGVREELQQTDYFKSRTRTTDQNLLIDKVNFVFNSIIEGNRHEWELNNYKPVPLNSKILAYQLGFQNYKSILNLLQEQGWIQTDKKYLPAVYASKINAQEESNKVEAHSIKYGLTDKAKKQRRIKVGVLCKRTENRLKRFRENQFQNLLTDKEIHSKIIYSINDVQIDYESGLKVLNDSVLTEDQVPHYHEALDTLQKMSEASTLDDFIKISGYYYTYSKKVGRIFHTLTNIPKSFRHLLTHKDDSQLTEIDLSNSQILLLFSDYLKNKIDSEKRATAIHKEIRIEKEGEGGGEREGSICVALAKKEEDVLKDLLIKGDFYKAVSILLIQEGNAERSKRKKEKYFELGRLHNANYGDFKAMVLGMGLFNKLIPIKEAHPVEQLLNKHFPNFIGYIRGLKEKHGYKEPALIAQRAESFLFIKQVYSNLTHGQDFAIPVHDSLIVKTEEADSYLDLLSGLFQTFHGHLELNAEQTYKLFKTKDYCTGGNLKLTTD